uniref:Syntaxin N-terminal domain-containing protein n=1 Tax=Aegilops tauschii subsp. strangulata TaxID=200361 RepID=A0A453K1Q0_AEGTS
DANLPSFQPKITDNKSRVPRSIPVSKNPPTSPVSLSPRNLSAISWSSSAPSRRSPLSRMRNLLSNSFELNKEERPPGNVDIELGLQGDLSGSAQPGFDGFYEQVREIDKLLETLTKLLKDLQNSNEESKIVTKASAMKDIKRRMEKDVNEVTKVARLTKSKLQQLNKERKAGLSQGIKCGPISDLSDNYIDYEVERTHIRVSDTKRSNPDGVQGSCRAACFHRNGRAC